MRKVPKAATKMMHGLKGMAYVRLAQLELFCLSGRRWRGHCSSQVPSLNKTKTKPGIKYVFNQRNHGKKWCWSAQPVKHQPGERICVFPLTVKVKKPLWGRDHAPSPGIQAEHFSDHATSSWVLDLRQMGSAVSWSLEERMP